MASCNATCIRQSILPKTKILEKGENHHNSLKINISYSFTHPGSKGHATRWKHGMKKSLLIGSCKKWLAIPATMALSVSLSHADIPDRDRNLRGSQPISGMYQVVSSNDPLFPLESQSEWFLDFNEGTSAGRTSGKVAVSLRQNPRVQVRVLVWQIFPEQGSLVIGNQFSEGSRGAVALASWNVSAHGPGITLTRDGRHITLRRAQPGDY